jgi:acyl-CoA reductase-like NAD-dependent aldehyde dehydrogenase
MSSGFGLNAALWTNDLSRAMRAARAIESGDVLVDCFDQGSSSMSTEPWIWTSLDAG